MSPPARLVAVVAVPVKAPTNVVAVAIPLTFNSVSVPTFVREELTTPLPSVVDVKTSVPQI